MIDKILKGFRELLEKIYIEDDSNLYKKIFVKTLRAYALYEILDEQFKKNNFYVISERDVENG